jgi:hypothetical protein
VSCTLQEPYIESSEAVIVPRNFESNQFDQFFFNRRPLSCWTVKLEVAIEHILPMREAPDIRSVRTTRFQFLNVRPKIFIQFAIFL